MSGSEIITVQGLTKFFGEVVGIEHLSLAVQRGEIFGFLGPNGAGKTTTIRLLLDLLRPSSGIVTIFGKPISENSLEIRRRCGYLPGSFAAYGAMRAGEYLRFMADVRGTRAESQAELLQRFSISPANLQQRIKHLSHGTLQKLAIVQAFFHRPELLILDEPTTGLDPLMQEQLYDLLRACQERGSTVFFSSHNLPEVEKTCHRVAIIRDGRLVALETLEQLKEKRFRKLQLTLHRPVEGLQLPGARLARQQGCQYDFLVKGDIKDLLSHLMKLPIANLVFPEPDLEEVFMAYYRSADDDS